MLIIPAPDGAPDGRRQDQLVPDERSVDPDGSIRLVLAEDSPALGSVPYEGDGGRSAVLETIDVAPVSVPHRIRGRSWVSGRLTRAAGTAAGPGRVVLRLDVTGACVDDLWGAGRVEPADFAAAVADPLAAYEAELLQHLHAAHGAEVRRLRELLGARADEQSGAGAAVVPVALDRFGLRVRFTGVHCFDARFDFPEPVRNVNELRRAMHTLFDAAAS